ncbi:MAG TPA: amino acid adenylation domain-containing protein [Amycolatopsis sp.]|uniref:amino acid adenylation domain-containing protein n=1 Tax=Amycolatopsis sp. TaxID=37632 RepID=UPI002B499BB0|nr:amino acid adenylation domain-containing protein [Amycolatopsis sp.]HKS46134.1 amino acid adenylation domain-containing protein [Amycolatopsis sp.]
MTVLVLHRLGSVAGAPYRSWLADYDGDVLLLAGREFLDLVGEDLPTGTGDYAHAEAVRGYDVSGQIEARCLELAERHGIRHLVACNELDLERAAQLREIAGLPGPRLDALIPFRDKLVMKDLAAAAGLAVPPYRDVECATDLVGFVAEHGLPVVLKPRDSASSVGVRTLRTSEDLDDFLDNGFDLYGPHHPNLLVESFVPGRMCHVDGLVLDGRIVAVWPSQYQYALATFATDRGGRLDLTLDRDDPLTGRLIEYTERLLDALPGDEDFAFHAEIFHTPDDRLLLCEIAARAGGAGVRDTQHLLFGFDPSETVVRAQLGLPLPERLRGYRLRPARMAGQLVLMKRPGRVVTVPDGPPPFEWVEKFRVFVHSGQSMAAARHSGDFMVMAIVAGPDRRTCENRLRQVEEWFLAGLVLDGTDDDTPDSGAPGDATLTDLLDMQAQARPKATAVISGSERLTFAGLADRARRVAGHLLGLSVAPDDRVGLFVEASTDLMVGAWGIVRARGAYLPLSPEYPDDRVRYMITDAGVRIILTQQHLRARLAALVPPGVTIVTVAEARAAQGNPVPSPAPRELAYVIYTSGSTGAPKGVMIEHRTIVSQLRWLQRAGHLGQDKTVLQKTPMSFDAAQWEILAPACGSTVVMGDPEVYRDPDRLIETVIEHNVTTLQCVPTLLQALVDHDEFPRCKSLTQVFSGGEVLTRSLARQLLAALPECELVNLYGPTECTINTSAHTVDRASVDGGPAAISIGRPVDGTVYHVLDTTGAPVADGGVGELHIGGVLVARGYLGRPELTAERFIANPLADAARHPRLFRTGDLVRRNADGTVEFVGRTDNQVKLRGYRVELDEIRLVIENHPWVAAASVVVSGDPGELVAFVELSPRQAALMDQGNHGAHHRSKENRLQVRAQLANPGCRDAEELAGAAIVDLPGRDATPEQRRLAFSRKTYRFFEGGEVRRADLERLLAGTAPAATPARDPRTLTLTDLGHLLRNLGAHVSEERLLPKYAYASPGALYATQLYLEIHGVAGLRPGCYYYHPARHQLALINEHAGNTGLRLHLVGRRRAIEPVYRNNIREVLQIEAGHLIGLLEEILPAHGLDVVTGASGLSTKDLRCAKEDCLLGTFDIVPGAGRADTTGGVDLYVQSHPGRVADLAAGQYHYRDGRLVRVSDQLVERHHVIAINQQVYDRAGFGISAVTRTRGWRAYTDLGRVLQKLSMNDLRLGFMSAGYSSETGAGLPSARRIASVLGAEGASYFFLGGKVSAEQWRSEGMKEDTVHMNGPAEMVRDDLVATLPRYMVPNRVVVLDELPRTPNGKVDVRALKAREVAPATAARPQVPPRTPVERRIAEIWKAALKRPEVSVHDDFFAAGGNSLIAVGLVNRLNREFRTSLPAQVLFEHPTIGLLAETVAGAGIARSRLVRLTGGSREPVFCWPGLGGYPMNLRPLAGRLGLDRPLYGVQAYGINEGETPYATIGEMAAADVELIRRLRPGGPYTLWGYSFGARPAFEAAYQLERAGERVDHLFLIAPGAPEVPAAGAADPGRAAFDNPVYVTILFSIFAGGITDPALRECLATATDEASFASFISDRYPDLGVELVRRIVAIVRLTYSFGYTFSELAMRRIAAPVTIIKARGDDYSFIESSDGYAVDAPLVRHLGADHYGMLREPGADELAQVIRQCLGNRRQNGES